MGCVVGGGSLGRSSARRGRRGWRRCGRRGGEGGRCSLARSGGACSPSGGGGFETRSRHSGGGGGGREGRSNRAGRGCRGCRAAERDGVWDRGGGVWWGRGGEACGRGAGLGPGRVGPRGPLAPRVVWWGGQTPPHPVLTHLFTVSPHHTPPPHTHARHHYRHTRERESLSRPREDESLPCVAVVVV